jgi:hypothetical protein
MANMCGFWSAIGSCSSLISVCLLVPLAFLRCQDLVGVKLRGSVAALNALAL